MTILFSLVTQQELAYFGLALFIVVLGLFVWFLLEMWDPSETTVVSPYSGSPVRRGSDLHWMTIEKVLRSLYHRHDYYNRMFDVQKSVICRDTGRVFAHCVNWYGKVELDWSFLQKRYPGHYVSWGSLTEDQQLLIREKHESLEGFQTEFSSSIPSPSRIEKEYALARPGPLYVDIDTGVLLGWKEVPDTELEVLIVQKPKEIYLPKLEETSNTSES